MRNKLLYFLIVLVATVLFAGAATITAQAGRSEPGSIAAGRQTALQQTSPTPTAVPGAGATDSATNSAMDHSNMAGMESATAITDTMSGHDMSGMDMSGMDMSGMDMSGMDMSDGTDAAMDMDGHGMEAIPSEGVPPATETTGAQPLDYVLDGDTKVFTLTAQAVQWPIMEGVTVTAYSYNGMVPGPLLRVTEGDNVRVVLQNQLPDATTIHWHGILVPNSMDGVAGVTQAAVQPGETFTYEFMAKPAGSFMYHSHTDSDKQVGLGLYAPFVIDPAQPESPAPDVDVIMMLSEARVIDGTTYEAMPMAGAEPNYFLINGKSFPATETIPVKKGDRVRIRFMGIGQFVHPMHLHGMPFKIVATDGYAVPEAAQLTKDTVLVAPGERYDVEFIADEPGQWVLHCHILHHTTNDNVEPGGLMMMFDVTE
jgi:FtsP/CotA-like multicopper oxidase with cupredoxin domain